MEHIPVYTYADGSAIPRLGQGTWYLGEKRSARREELAALRTGIECGHHYIIFVFAFHGDHDAANAIEHPCNTTGFTEVPAVTGE